MEWLRRVWGRYTERIQETLAKKVNPNLRHASYRDDEPKLVFLAACFMVNSASELKEIFTSEKVYKSKMADWRRGALDSDLFPHVKLLSKDFALSDLRFITLATLVETALSGDGAVSDLSQAQRAKMQADFDLFFERLKFEESIWRKHVVALKEWNSEVQAVQTAYLERLYDTQMEAINAHMRTHFATSAFENLNDAAAYCSQVTHSLADSPPAVQTSQIARINVYNLPMLGQKASVHLAQLADLMSLECTSNPHIQACIVIAPNTPASMKGPPSTVKGFDRAASIARATEEHKDLARTALTSHKELLVVACSGLYEEKDFYSSTRDLRLEFYLVMSSSCNEQGGKKSYNSLWSKSKLFKRKCLPILVDPLQRSQFTDWTKTTAALGGANLDHSQEMKQWHSGQVMLGAILETLIADTGLQDSRVHVRDFTMYDSELAKAVMAWNCRADCSINLAYVGVSWCEAKGKQGILENVTDSIREQLLSRVRGTSGATPYQLFQVKRVPQPAPQDAAQRPKYEESIFEVTRPRESDLPIRQVVYDLWSSSSMTTSNANHTFDEIVTAHNSEFNPSGVPFKAGLVRLLDSASASAVVQSCSPAVDLPTDPEGPSKDDLVQDHGGIEVTTSSSMYSFVVTASGELYMNALEDGILPVEDSWFSLRGTFKKDAEARGVINGDPEGPWVDTGLAEDTLVIMTSKQALQEPLPEGPTRLDELLFRLEKMGHVRVDLKFHRVTRKADSPSSFAVECLERTGLPKIKHVVGLATLTQLLR